MGTIGFCREGLVDWRRGGRIAVLVALGTAMGSLIAVEFSEDLLDAIVVAGLLLVLGMLIVRLGHWLEGKEGRLRSFGWGQAAYRWPWAAPSGRTWPHGWSPRIGPECGSTAFSCYLSSWRSCTF
jgi:uncharacterized membrane protein YfcA